MSLNTWVLGVFATLFGLANGVIAPMDALFVQVFAGMQLVEFFMWRAIEAGTSTRPASMAGLALILAQPAVSALRLAQTGHGGRPRLGWAVLAAYVVITTIYMTFTHPTRFESEVGASGHLRWLWASSSSKTSASTYAVAAWATALIAPLVLMRGGWNHACAALAVLTLLASCWFFWRDGTWGSVWCWVVNAVSLGIIAAVFVKETCYSSAPM